MEKNMSYVTHILSSITWKLQTAFIFKAESRFLLLKQKRSYGAYHQSWCNYNLPREYRFLT